MEHQTIPSSGPLPEEEVDTLKGLLWGKDIKSEVFRRWTQGVDFSEQEVTAVVQHDGGPCAVIAPLQAFFLKNLLFSRTVQNDWRSISVEERSSILCHAVADMLSLVSSSDEMTLLEHVPQQGPDQSPPSIPPRAPIDPDQGPPAPPPRAPTINTSPSGGKLPAPAPGASQSPDIDPSSSSSQPSGAANETADSAESTSAQQNGPISRKSKDACSDEMVDEAGAKKKRLSHEEFHSSLRCIHCNRADLVREVTQWLPNLEREYGVLLLLYSIIYTKGLQTIKNEVEDMSEPLIDGTFGHGSQSLINLLITGRAVSNVWDNDKDVSGLKLYGIDKQATIGFLTQLEHLRYCEVGWYLKNPKYPVWLLGSETHLTVVFSLERSLVRTESPEAEARRIFSNFDQEGCGFLQGDRLGDLMDALNLVSDPDYVKLMREKLDPEQLGIVTLNAFLEEFFPGGGQPEGVQRFCLIHYNGQPRSCPDNKVVYAMCQAEIQEFPELQIITDTSPMKTCLMTKWPTLDLKWTNNVIPSLN